MEALIWSPFFGAAGLGFAYVLSRRESWWAAIPAGVFGVLVGIGAEGPREPRSHG